MTHEQAQAQEQDQGKPEEQAKNAEHRKIKTLSAYCDMNPKKFVANGPLFYMAIKLANHVMNGGSLPFGDPDVKFEQAEVASVIEEAAKEIDDCIREKKHPKDWDGKFAIIVEVKELIFPEIVNETNSRAAGVFVLRVFDTFEEADEVFQEMDKENERGKNPIMFAGLRVEKAGLVPYNNDIIQADKDSRAAVAIMSERLARSGHIG